MSLHEISPASNGNTDLLDSSLENLVQTINQNCFLNSTDNLSYRSIKQNFSIDTINNKDITQTINQITSLTEQYIHLEEEEEIKDEKETTNQSKWKSDYFKPSSFWNDQSNLISNHCWKPNNLDHLNYQIDIRKDHPNINPKHGFSWFQIEEKQNLSQLKETKGFEELEQKGFKGILYLDENNQENQKINSIENELNDNTNLNKDIEDLNQEENQEENEKVKYKTLKIRLYPTREEKELLDLRLDQFRWYYNATVNTFFKEFSKDFILHRKWNFSEIREIIKAYNYIDHQDKNQQFIRKKECHCFDEYKEKYTQYKIEKKEWTKNEKDRLDQEKRLKQAKKEKKKIIEEKIIKTKHPKSPKFQMCKCITKEYKVPIPEWWSEKKVHSRIQRGASKKFSQNINSIISNFYSKNIDHFKMNFKCKKDTIQYLCFEDESFPKDLLTVKSKYWFRKKESNKRSLKRVALSFKDIFEKGPKKRGFELIHDKIKDQYFIHYPIERNWFPSSDIRIEKQDSLYSETNQIISLDPGLRKFLVGYDPNGKSIFFGDKAQHKLIPLLLKIDEKVNKEIKRDTLIRWRYLKNLVDELHWKIIHYLISHYDTILLPIFNTSQMIQKGKLSKISKRIMTMFRFYSFKEKLNYKCRTYGKKLYIVNESYTSKTCGNCGFENEKNSKEIFECKSCKIKMDRDAQSSRNILIRNIII